MGIYCCSASVKSWLMPATLQMVRETLSGTETGKFATMLWYGDTEKACMDCVSCFPVCASVRLRRILPVSFSPVLLVMLTEMTVWSELRRKRGTFVWSAKGFSAIMVVSVMA